MGGKQSMTTVKECCMLPTCGIISELGGGTSSLGRGRLDSLGAVRVMLK